LRLGLGATKANRAKHIAALRPRGMRLCFGAPVFERARTDLKIFSFVFC
jgi:hypothetical protein